MNKIKSMCSGCYNNDYNNGLGGAKECWSFKDAEIVSRILIGNWENPPYLNKKKYKVLNCFHERGSNRTHYIDPNSIDSQGYWK